MHDPPLLTSPAPSTPLYGLFLLLGFALAVFVASLLVLSGVLLADSLTDFLLCFELASAARREIFAPTQAAAAFVLPRVGDCSTSFVVLRSARDFSGVL